jgi:hypothetical protein
MIIRNAFRLEKLPEDDRARTVSLSNATRERIKKALREVPH